MWMLHDGRVLAAPMNFTDVNGTLQSGKFLTDPTKRDERLTLGIREFVEEKTPVGYRAITSTDTEDAGIVTRSHTFEANQTLDELKAVKIKGSKIRCAATLAETDWCYIRQLRNGTPVPEDVIAKGVQAYEDNASEEALINSQTDYDELLALELGVTNE